MRYRAAVVVFLFGLAALPLGQARACGFSEAPGDCGETPEIEAREMLARVVAAVQSNEGKALQEFTAGENGFRTSDYYVFCVGPDGVMSAHPNPALKGTDVRDLHDSKGNRFIAKMMERARPGQVASIRYLFPRPGGTREYPKVTYYTRAGDQVCGVGVYDGTETVQQSQQTPQARLDDLRRRLTSEMPPNLAPEWAAFQHALDDDNAAKTEAFAKVREQVHAAETVLAPNGAPLTR